LASIVLLFLGLSFNDSKHLSFQTFFVLRQAVLFPGVVKDFGVEVVAAKTVLEQSNALLVVWFLFELQRPAVLHELFKFSRVALAQLFQRSLDLLLLNSRILLVLRASRKSLPGQSSLQKV
jgi:hypothetical protein